MTPAPRASVVIDGREVALTNLDKPFWPESGFTKGDMVRYYVTVAPFLLPHLAGRPLNLTRFPNGIGGKHFYQKDIPETAPPWVRTVRIAHSDHDVNYCLADSPAVLAWLAQWGCIEIHPWLSRVDALDSPDFAVFDLDPSPPATFSDAVELAFVVRNFLDEFGLRVYPKTSGATGLHLFLPIVRRYAYKEVEEFVGRAADAIHRVIPDRTTRERSVAKRRGIYIDHLQNIKGKTLASVYSLRPEPGAPVSTPVTWDELPRIAPGEFNLATVPDRLARLGDLFAPALRDVQDPEPMMKALGVWPRRPEGAGRVEGPVRGNRPFRGLAAEGAAGEAPYDPTSTGPPPASS